MTYRVRLEIFEGPLDLLLYLIRKNELDIYDISIITITQQYLEYLDLMKALNLEIAGEFLVMAATLMHIKSRSLLPNQEDEIDAEQGPDPLEELRRQLLEYQKFKDAAHALKEHEILEKDVFTRSYFEERNLKTGDTVEISDISLFDLLNALKTILKKTGNSEAFMEVTAEQISVKDRINWILDILKTRKSLTFEALFADMQNKVEIVSTFLALLELIRLQAVQVLQQSLFGTIHIYAVDSAPDNTEALTAPVDESYS
jgi:segregation and condensation protein A